MTALIGDPRVAAVELQDNDEPLVDLGPELAVGERPRVRAGLAARLQRAQQTLPAGIWLHVVEGFRSPAD